MAKIPKSSRQVIPSGRVAGGQVPFDIADTGQGLGAKGLGDLGRGAMDVGNVLMQLKERKDRATDLTQSGLDQQAQQSAEAQINIAETDVSINDRTSDYYNKEYQSRFTFDPSKYGTSQAAKLAKINFDSRRDAYVSSKGIKNAQLAVKGAVQLTEQNYLAQPNPVTRLKYEEALRLQESEEGVEFKLNQADATAMELVKGREIGAVSGLGFTAWQETVTVEDPDGDLTASFKIIQESGLAEEDKVKAESILNTRVTNRRAEAKLQLESKQEDSRDEINKALFEDKNYGISDALIADSPLDEKEQTAFFKLSEQRASAAARGVPIKNDRVEESRLYEESLGIWKGSVTKKQFDADVIANASKLDDEAYRRVTSSAANTLKSSQAEALSRGNQEAKNVLVDFKSDDAFSQFVADSIKGLKPDIAKAFEDNANKNRQLQYDSLSRYNAELRQWIQENPDKLGKDFYQFSESLKQEYWRRDIDDLEKLRDEFADKLKGIEKKQPQATTPPAAPAAPTTVIMVSPTGKRYNVPSGKIKKFKDNGFKEE